MPKLEFRQFALLLWMLLAASLASSLTVDNQLVSARNGKLSDKLFKYLRSGRDHSVFNVISESLWYYDELIYRLV